MTGEHDEDAAESNQGRPSAARNSVPSNLDRTPSRNHRRSSGLLGVREAARGSRDLKFAALLHHVNIELLTSSFYRLKKNAAVGVQLRRRRHDRVGETGRWLASVIRGWLGYHAVPDNHIRLDQLVTEVTKLWLHQLRRRSQKGRAAWPWSRMQHLVDRYLPQPKILHPYPKDRFRARLAAGAV